MPEKALSTEYIGLGFGFRFGFWFGFGIIHPRRYSLELVSGMWDTSYTFYWAVRGSYLVRIARFPARIHTV